MKQVHLSESNYKWLLEHLAEVQLKSKHQATCFKITDICNALHDAVEVGHAEYR